MTNEHDFATSVGRALHDVAQASSPAADLAERIIANATSGR